MEPQLSSSPPETKVKTEAEVKTESEPTEQQSSVIIRRQIITTAGTIEEQTTTPSSAVEDSVQASNTPLEGSPQNGVVAAVEYEETVEQQVGNLILKSLCIIKYNGGGIIA